jgi:DNA topoisomerase-1
LPALRKKVEEDITGRAISFDTVVAAVVRLIDSTHMRVGNKEYAEDNKSFGATTLRNRHARVVGGKLRLSYTGKHGIKREAVINDRNLARIAKRTQDLPGQNLFECVDGEGGTRPVTSTDVNSYIKDAMGEDFTAKDFRTWGASVIAFEEMVKRAEGAKSINLKAMIEPVAEALGNTVAISRKSYVHPALIEAAKDAGAIGARELPRAGKYLSRHERGLIEFIKALPKEKAAAEVKIKAKAKRMGTSRGEAEAQVAAEGSAGLTRAA